MIYPVICMLTKVIYKITLDSDFSIYRRDRNNLIYETNWASGVGNDHLNFLILKFRFIRK